MRLMETSNTDAARYARLTAGAKRLLATIEWTRLQGAAQYHGQAAAPGAKLELEAAQLVAVTWSIDNPADDRLHVKRAGWRIAARFCAGGRVSSQRVHG